MATDLGDGWDFWPYMRLPLREARRRLDVPPLGAELRAGAGVCGPPIGRWK